MNYLNTVVNFLDQLLKPEKFPFDRCYNGLQISTEVDIKNTLKTVALAVDPSEYAIHEAIKQKADLLITHHGLIYGDHKPVVGPYGKKIKLLLSNNLSLYCSHLPLDSNMKVGNAYCIAKKLNLKKITPFLEYKNSTIGVSGLLPKKLNSDLVKKELRRIINNQKPLELFFGKKLIHSVAIATGAAGFGIEICAQKNFDLFITGEPSNQNYHDAKELNLNVFFGGHYHTETFGVKAIGEKLKNTFGLKTFFIEEPTGI